MIMVHVKQISVHRLLESQQLPRIGTFPGPNAPGEILRVRIWLLDGDPLGLRAAPQGFTTPDVVVVADGEGLRVAVDSQGWLTVRTEPEHGLRLLFRIPQSQVSAMHLYTVLEQGGTGNHLWTAL